MIEIIPSILVDSEKEFERRLRLVEGHAKVVHVDILDGTLFPETNWFDARSVGAFDTPVLFELHLMVKNPLPIIADWKKHVEGTKSAIVHAEIERPLGIVLEHIREVEQLEAGVALNPETPFEAVRHVMTELDMLLVMGVHPGASGQAFLGDSILEKIRAARGHGPSLPIEVDGGITEKFLRKLADAGATRICLASAIFSTSDPQAALERLQKAASTLS